jgi:hypothetical protein
MKKLLVITALALLCGLRLYAQESSVKILLNEEERFRFDSIRLAFINSGHHVMIGDSTGMNDTANARTIENTFVGHRAGSIIQSGDDNTFLGALAGEYHVRGPENLFLGAGAGRYDSAGYFNTYVGPFAGYSNKTGFGNTIIGYFAGTWGDSARYNVIVGYNAGPVNTSGRLNAFIGTTSGFKNTSGSQNTFLGTSAGGSNTTGSYNTYIGRRAGMNNQEGSGNTFLGFYAGANETGSNKLYIENSDTDKPLIYGEFDNKLLRFNAGRIELRNPSENTIIGDSSGIVMNGMRNVFMGYNAGHSNTDGADNTFIGDSAGYSNTTGNSNVFVGNYAGYASTTAGLNVFIGPFAGLSNTTGYRNTFIGPSAGMANTTGYRNTFVGLSAGANNISGLCNTYIGRIAGFNNQEGDSNVFIGNAAGQYEMGSEKLYISNSATIEPLIYGDFTEKNLKFNAGSVETTGDFLASGEIRSDQNFNAGGLPGITDTINIVTDISFTQNKLRYRTSVYTGGIVTFISPESAWVDVVGAFILEE